MSRQGLYTTTVDAICTDNAQEILQWMEDHGYPYVEINNFPSFTMIDFGAVKWSSDVAARWIAVLPSGEVFTVSDATFENDFLPAAPARSSYRTGGPIGTKEWAEYADQIASSGTVGDVLQAMITFYEDGITLEDKNRWGELVEQIVEPAYEKICELNRAPATSEEPVPAETEAPAQLVDAIRHMNHDQLLGALTTAKTLLGAHQLDQTGLLDMILTRLIHQDDDSGDDEKPHPSGDNYARTEIADPHPVGFTIDPISTSL